MLSAYCNRKDFCDISVYSVCAHLCQEVYYICCAYELCRAS